jgi:hypothetical protein
VGRKTWFKYCDKGVYKASVPSSGSKTVHLMVQTWGNSPLGEKKATAYVGDIRLDVYVHIASANMSADFSFNVNSKIAYIGGQLLYDSHLKNLQSKENFYKLAVTGL